MSGSSYMLNLNLLNLNRQQQEASLMQDRKFSRREREKYRQRQEMPAAAARLFSENMIYNDNDIIQLMLKRITCPSNRF